MKQTQHRRAFTIVELVIVIAVIAILATVLVPTFGDVVSKANQAKDIQTAKNMNTALAVYSATMSEELPGNSLIQNIDDVMAALTQAGFDTVKELTPVRKGHTFYWYKTTNQIVYVDEKDAAFALVYPKDIPNFPESKDNTLINIADHAPDGTAEPADPSNPYAGKVISVLGDSISTFEGYIPKADGFNLEHLARYATDYEATGVTDVNETYWMQVIHALDAKLGINDSWRGAMVSGWDPVTTDLSGTGERASFADLTRIQNLGSNGTPDVILFYGGTNDLAHGKSLGTFDPASAPTQPDLQQKTVWDNLSDAYCETLLRLKHFYPDAVIVAILPAETVSYYTAETLAAGNILMAQICRHYGVPCLDLQGQGISVSNPGDNIHPNWEGMDRITELLLELLGQQDITPGRNVVYEVKHTLTYATASKNHIRGISAGNPFTEAIAGTDLTVTVTMGGRDITASCYADGVITIPAVTGDIVITAAASAPPSPWETHLQERPADPAANLWAALQHQNLYYTVNDWGNNGSNSIWSITVPVQPGEQIYASSFESKSTNGSGSTDGIRVAFLLSNGDVLQKVPDKVFSEFSAKGYLEVPADAVAVSIPMWNNSSEWEVYIGVSVAPPDHSADNIGNRLQPLPDDFTGATNLWEYLRDKTIGERYRDGAWIALDANSPLRSVLIPVSEGMRIRANSFDSMDKNGSNHTYDGVRITWFFEGNAPVEVLNNDVYREYADHGCLTAPEGVIAVNIVWWTDDDSNFLYVTLPDN